MSTAIPATRSFVMAPLYRGFLMLAAVALAGSAVAQVRLPASEQLPQRSPIQRQQTRPTIIPLTVWTVRHPMNVYQTASLKADSLFGRDLVVQGYTLDGLLRRTAGNLDTLAEQGYTLTLRTRSGQMVKVPLTEVLGRGGLLAYAEAGQQQWQPFPTVQQAKEAEVNTQIIYLVWPEQAPRPELAGLWDVTRITLSR